MEERGRARAYSPFATTSQERRQRVYDAAVHEFAVKGFNAANINTIARAAGISIGSMYSYFESKEELFLEVMEHCLETMYRILSSVDTSQGVVHAFSEMLHLARSAAHQYPEMNQIYLDCASQSLVNLSKQLSYDAEAVTVKLYKDVLACDKALGRVRKDLDVATTAFLLDNLVMMYQFSFVSHYYNERKKLFLGSQEVADSDEIIAAMVAFVRRAVEPSETG